MDHEPKASAHKGSFIKGLLAGIAIVVVLGSAYMLGARSSGNLPLSNSGNGGNRAAGGNPQPSAPLPNQPPDPVNLQLNPVTDEDWVRGNRKAKVSLIEF